MKKQLREELTNLAEKILNLRSQEELPTAELKILALKLYEKLTVLDFTESHLFSSEIPVKAAESDSQTTSLSPEKPAAQVSQENLFSEAPLDSDPVDEHDEYAPDGTQYNTEEGLMEPNTEKIKDIVAQMPPEAQEVDDMLEYILPRRFMKNDMEDIGGVHYDQLPQFEPAEQRSSEPQKPRSLNDKLKKGIQIGLNDRLAFVRHLFDGSTSDYNRVLSQLNTFKSRQEAVDFVHNMVKPDYNNWAGKEVYELRFLDIVENRFD